MSERDRRVGPPELGALPVRLGRGLRKAIVLLTVCLAFATVGVLMARDGETAAYFVAAVSGPGALVAAIHLHPRSSYLELRPEGFTVCSLLRRSFVPWHHVEAFIAIRMHSNAMVGWTCTPAFTGSRTARRTSLALAGVEAALPDPYGMKATDLVAVMNLLLATAFDRDQNVSGTSRSTRSDLLEPSGLRNGQQ